jgi:hypothetical protein
MRPWLLLLPLVGCVARIGEPDADPLPTSGAPPIADPPSTRPPAPPQTPGIPSAPLRRLTTVELLRSVRATLGVDLSDLTFPSDGANEGYSNDASLLVITSRHAEAYQLAAEETARRVVSNPALRGRWVTGCDPITEPCLPSVVERLGSRIQRAPLDPEERAALIALATAQLDPRDPDRPLAVLIEALLQSPRFLFRVELGTADPGRPAQTRLDPYALASRLSYLLWQEPPDDALWAVAHELADASVLSREAQRLLADPRAMEARRIFVEGWLRLDELADRGFPLAITSAAADAASAQALDVLSPARPARDLFTAGELWIRAELAPIFGIAAPDPGVVERVDEPSRGGILGSAAFLMLASSPSATSIVHRGKLVRELVLCDPIPPPPPGVNTTLLPGESPLDGVARRAADPVCGGCHRRMDGIGLGLERYDPLGAERSAYPGGGAVPPEGYLELDGSRSAFAGSVALGRMAVERGRAERCLIEHTWRWARGRSVEPADQAALEGAAAALDGTPGDYGRALLALIGSESFTTRPSPEECVP